MPEANIFELAELGDKADAEKARQAKEFSRLGVEPPKEANINVFQQAEADLKKEKPTEDSPSLLRRAFSTVKGIPIPMATTAAGGAIGTAVAPGIGTLIGSMLGGGGGEWLQQLMGVTDPSKLDIALSTAAPGIGKVMQPAYRLAKSFTVGSLGTRELVADAAESLLRKWMTPGTTAKTLYEAAEATKKIIPMGETARTVDNLLQKEITRMPLPQQKEVLEILGPLQNFTTVGRGKGFQMVRSSPVADAMTDVTRLREGATEAFKAGNNSLGHSLNNVRGALLNDLEKAGVPEVKLAAKAARKEMALEDLGRLIHKPGPGEKISDFSKKNKLFAGTFTDKEWGLIDKVVDKVSMVAPTGFKGAAGRAITTAAGGALGGGWNPLGYLIGALGPEGARKFFTSAKGQAFIQGTLSKDITYGPEWAAAAAMFARGLMGQVGGGETE